MTMESVNTENAALAAQAVRYQGQRNFAALRSVVSHDVVLEFPFHPDGAETHEGADEMIRLFSVIEVFDKLEIEPIRVFDPGNGTVIVEARSVGTYRSGSPEYRNHYLFIMSIENGLITRWREFYNPVEAIKFYECYDENIRFNAGHGGSPIGAIAS